MAKCAMCGNNYDKAFNVTTAEGATHTFDCFECAIHMLAPGCAHCGVRVIGHGSEHDGTFYCSAHCGRQSGISGLDDRT